MRRSERQRRRIAERMAIRCGLLTTKTLDYRYWQARRCGFDPNNAEVWEWWRRLHWMDRDLICRLSPRYMIFRDREDTRRPAA